MRFTLGQITLENGRHDRFVSQPDHAAAGRLAAVTRLLPAEDRRLVDLLLVRRLSHRAAAEELHVAPGVISRRVTRIRNLVASPTVRAIAEHVDSLAEPVRRIAVDHFFNRLSVKLIADRLDVPRREVQSHLDYIRGWARALHRAAVRGRAEITNERDGDE